MGLQITPSILTADFAELGAEVRRIPSADWVHVDVMDNRFVPNVTFHVEAAAAPVRLAREIRAQGARASMALKPATPIEPYEDLLPELDMVLVMTVEPGFGGQSFLDLCLPKIRTARALMRKHGLETWLQVDGGISLETIERCADAGADVFVAGSAVFSADDPDAMVATLRAKAEAAVASR